MLNHEDITRFEQQGYLIYPNLIAMDIIKAMIARADALGETDGPERIIETSGDPCSIYIHHDDDVFEKIMRLPALVTASEQLLNSSVYIHQCKVNHKMALTGSEVMWHRDFTYWNQFDNMPTDNALTVAIALDDINNFNSPLLLLESSHKTMLEQEQLSSGNLNGAESDTSVELSWLNTEKHEQSTRVGQLRYTFNRDELVKLTSAHQIVPFAGAAGSVLIFHSNLVHGSNKNISPWDRRMIFITYNSVINALKPMEKPRAGFIANRDFTPL